MNTNPDEAALALWLDDELNGAEFASVEVWAAGHPEQIAARKEVRRWRAMMTSALPASEEPPFPDFLNSRVLQAISNPTSEPRPQAKAPSFWKSLLLPTAACAGMALTFWAGTKTNSLPEYDIAGAPRAIPVDPLVYTPVSGVNAEWFASTEASATVIVLSGVAAIPDTTDFSSTVYLPTDREIDSTAGIAPEPLSELSQ